MIKPDVPKISKPLHVFSIVLWAFCLLNVPLTLVIGNTLHLMPPFLILWVIALLSGLHSGGYSALDHQLSPDWLDRIANRAAIIATALAVISLMALFIAGGSARMVDDAYVIVDHGEIRRHISRSVYMLLQIPERLFFPCGLVVFSSTVMYRIRTLYRNQQVHAQRRPAHEHPGHPGYP